MGKLPSGRVEAAAGKVDWTAYPDQVAEELMALIDAKLAGQAVAETVAPPRILSLNRPQAWALDRPLEQRRLILLSSHPTRTNPRPVLANHRLGTPADPQIERNERPPRDSDANS